MGRRKEMCQVRLVIGKTAEMPYIPERIHIPAYTLEELCYLLKENVFLVDSGNVNRKMVDWIYEELELRDLSMELYSLLNNNGSVSAMVAILFEYAAYLEKEEIDEMERLIRENSGLSQIEKRKACGDYALKNNHFTEAITIYLELIELVEKEDDKLYGSILHNIGAAYAKLFQFEDAGEYFIKAYQKTKNRESYLCHLACLKFQMSDEEYIAYLSEHMETYEDSLELENRMAKTQAIWETSSEKLKLDELNQNKMSGNLKDYYQKADHIVNELKEKYRESAG